MHVTQKSIPVVPRVGRTQGGW